MCKGYPVHAPCWHYKYTQPRLVTTLPKDRKIRNNPVAGEVSAGEPIYDEAICLLSPAARMKERPCCQEDKHGEAFVARDCRFYVNILLSHNTIVLSYCYLKSFPVNCIGIIRTKKVNK